MFSLQGKTAVVSGGAGVIGTVMSEALLKAGAHVMIWSRSKESLDNALDKLKQVKDSGGRVAGMQVDAGIEEDIKTIRSTTESIKNAGNVTVPYDISTAGKSKDTKKTETS